MIIGHVSLCQVLFTLLLIIYLYFYVIVNVTYFFIINAPLILFIFQPKKKTTRTFNLLQKMSQTSEIYYSCRFYLKKKKTSSKMFKINQPKKGSDTILLVVTNVFCFCSHIFLRVIFAYFVFVDQQNIRIKIFLLFMKMKHLLMLK